jgi:hypothetical protein
MKRKTGSLLHFSRRGFAAAVFLLAFPVSKTLRAGKKKSADLYAVIGGTVFRDPGFALRGAEVVLQPEKPVVNGVKMKGQKAISDARGEYAFRVPPIEAKYSIKVSAEGMKGETKPAETRGGEERIDVTFTLLPASK